MTHMLNELMQSAVANGDTAGVNLLVLKNGKEVFYGDAGYRDLANQKPVTRDTIFRLYSQTKPVTAVAVMVLVSQGKIDLGGEVSDYLPEFKDLYVNKDGKRTPASRPMLVRDLMNMTSGLAYPNDITEGGRQSDKVFAQIDKRLYSDHPVTTAEFSRMMAKVDLCFEPGEQFMYGTSADILGALVEKVSGVSFGDFLRKNLFEPLEMNDTGFFVPKEKTDRLSLVYDYCGSGLKEVKTDHLGLRYMRETPPSFESGGAGLCSTLDDYSHFGTMLLNGGAYKGIRILPEAAVKFLTSGGITDVQKPQLEAGWTWMRGYTYGNLMRVCEDESRVTLFSSKGEYGWDGWLGTFFSNEPQHGITLLMGVQQVGIGRTGTLVRKMKNVVMSELT